MADGIALRFDAYTSGAFVGTPAYTAADERLLSTVLAGPGGALLARPGVRPGPGGAVTVGGTPEAVTVQPFCGIITDTAGGGSYLFVIPAAVSKTLATRPGSGTSRLDELVVKILNDGPRPADGSREVAVELITGTAGASPTAPTVPSGKLRIRELAVPASGTVSLSKPPPRIAALGGIIPVAGTSERDAIDSLYDGLMVCREDTGVLEARLGSSWKRVLTASATGDDTWIDLTLGSGFAHRASDQRTQAIRSAGMVTVALAATKASFAAGDVIATLPAGFLPISGAGVSRVRITGHYNNVIRTATVLTDGSGQIVSDGAFTSGIVGTVTYPAA